VRRPFSKEELAVSKLADRQLHAFVALLIASIVTIMVAPIVLPQSAHATAGRFMLSAVLLLALWAAGIRPRTLLFLLPLLLATLVLNRDAPTGALAAGIRAAFFGYATVIIVMHTIRARTVTADTLAGAACAYVLTGVTWANLYEILELLKPGSFDIPASWLLQPSHDPAFALQYFSFTTLTTVGYGDIHPTGLRGGGLAIGEAVVGQLYVAIMIARLVGLQLVQRP
jgi:hypothetical protein